jgi:nucleotide-binding universal stress UspA family protein
MLAWKETPEARRAALDALPMLQRAKRVTVVEISAEEALTSARQHLQDVSRWLERHGVAAETLAVLAQHDDGDQLEQVARELRATLIVAGAYGHSRLREWAFGSVTRTLLHGKERCVLLSH